MKVPCARSFVSAVLALGVLGALVTAPREAAAIENQHHIGVGGGLSILAIDDKSTASIGGGATFHYAYGLNDTWNLMVELSSSAVAANQQQDTPDTPRTRPAGVDYGSFGVGYVIDVLQWVPYLCVLGGAYRLSEGTLPQTLILPGVQAGLGLDYQLSRHFAVGATARQHFILGKLDTYPSYTTAILRVEYAWGF